MYTLIHYTLLFKLYESAFIEFINKLFLYYIY